MTWQPHLWICAQTNWSQCLKDTATHPSHHLSITHNCQGMETPKWMSMDELIKKAWGIIQLFHRPFLWSTSPSLPVLSAPTGQWMTTFQTTHTRGSLLYLGWFLRPCPNVAAPHLPVSQHTDKAVRKSEDIPTFPSPTNYALHSQASHLESEPPSACPKR